MTNRDRLRPLFGLKLQQEFGAHIMRVGPPVLPPMTTAATGRIFLCSPKRAKVGALDRNELMVTRFKESTRVRVTPRMAGVLRAHCEDLFLVLDEAVGQADANARPQLIKKQVALQASLEDDDFWIGLLKGVELSGRTVKQVGNLGFVLGSEWADTDKFRVVLELDETPVAPKPPGAGRAHQVADGEPEAGAVSGAA